MGEKVYFKGITWNHPRGYESIGAASRAFQQQYSEADISWDIRSLKDFGDYPVTLLAETYDFIMLDHPHIGSASRGGALIPLDEWLPEAFLKDQERNSVGKSYESYHMDGHQWALAVDAAAQIAAYRPDLAEKTGTQIPKCWEEVLTLAQKRPGGAYVGFPLCETDVYCSFLSLCANLRGDSFFDPAAGPEVETAKKAVELLTRLSEVIYPGSLDMNPIQMLERMAESDDILYVPLLFGYSNYARPQKAGRNLILFTDIPSFTGFPSGALLGGVGLAISSKCRDKALAAKFAMFAASGKVQKGIYFENAGQPGYLEAWQDASVNAACGNFFLNTLETLKHSYLRPRYEGYNEFQEKAGSVLNHGLKNRECPDIIVRRLRELFDSLKRGN